MYGDLKVHQGGSGQPQLLLLHGLGATAEVWNGWWPLLAERWPGRWLAPDLPGHGASPPLPRYTFADLAGKVAEILAPDTPTVVLGHSLGGVIGLAMADGELGVSVAGVIGLGIKVEWTDEELSRARAIAERATSWFTSRDEAAARYLRVSGLSGLLRSDASAVDAGLREEDGRWRLVMDQRAFAVGAPDMARLLARSEAEVTLARGEHDPMNTDEQLERLGVRTTTLPGLGHNAHVESPEKTLGLLGRYLGSAS